MGWVLTPRVLQVKLENGIILNPSPELQISTARHAENEMIQPESGNLQVNHSCPYYCMHADDQHRQSENNGFLLLGVRLLLQIGQQKTTITTKWSFFSVEIMTETDKRATTSDGMNGKLYFWHKPSQWKRISSKKKAWIMHV
jgi:hypothetical protein